MRRSTIWSWGLAVAALVCGLVATVVLSPLARSHGSPWWENAIFMAVGCSTVAVGLLVTTRQPANPIGWLLLAQALVVALAGLASAYARYAVLENPGALPGGRWAVLADDAVWPLLFAPLTAIAFVFPDGHLPSPRWRKGAVAGVASFAAVVLMQFGYREGFDQPFEQVTSPAADLPGLVWVRPFVLLAMLATMVAAAWAVRVRFRRATGIERLQLKWFTYAAVLAPATLAVCFLGGEVALTIALVLTLIGIPAAIAIAVLRYRLYDIDVVINRTLVYGALTAVLAAIYAAIASGLGVAAGGESAWITAVATLAAAAAFMPLRARIQDVVDRRFARARYDGLRRVDAFLSDLRAGRAEPEAIEGVLAQALGDPLLELRYRLSDSELHVDARGRTVTDIPDPTRHRTPVERAGIPLAMVIHEPALAAESPHLLASVVDAAGLAIEIARLRVELRRQLDEVEASRARIVAAGYEERKRIERDLHDGAQQRLVSVGLALRHLQHELPAGSNGRKANELDGVVDEIARAISELRELARGVRPSQLDDGLAAALRELAGRASLPIDVYAGPERYPENIEAAAYFIACEGLTNAIKHANASTIAVRAECHDERLVICVTDDGAGGAAPSRGSGLAGLADRVEAQGGTLRLESSPAGGTNLTAVLPLAA